MKEKKLGSRGAKKLLMPGNDVCRSSINALREPTFGLSIANTPGVNPFALSTLAELLAFFYARVYMRERKREGGGRYCGGKESDQSR